MLPIQVSGEGEKTKARGTSASAKAASSWKAALRWEKDERNSVFFSSGPAGIPGPLASWLWCARPIVPRAPRK